MNKLLLRYLIFFSVSFVFTPAMAQFYNGTQMEFGKNRVQYREFNWLYYPFERFEVYHYRGGSDLARYVALSADKSLKEIESFFDFTIPEKTQILCYNKQNEFRQSNIGVTGDDEYNIGGATQIVGSKIFVYYETDHKTLDDQIKSNLALMVFRNMMYGGDWKDVWKSSSMLSVPEWYETGIVSFMTHGWSSDVESRVRADFLNGKYRRFNDLYGEDARYGGHALWKYLADVYGESVIPNVLYMTKVSRNIESGFLLVLGVSLESLMRDFNSYYSNYFIQNEKGETLPEMSPEFTGKQILSFKGEKGDKKQQKLEEKILGELPVKYKSKYTYSQMKLNPSGDKVAFATNEMGQYKIWIYDLNAGKLKKVFKKEYKLERIIDNTFPILTWHPSGLILTFTYEDKGRAFIGNYNLDEKKVTTKELFRIDKVIDFDYSDDGRQMIFTGVREGQTDLYLYQVIGNNQRQLTNDIYDDVDARFIRNSTAVIFASNRPDDTLRSDVPVQLFNLNKDIYILDLESDDDILERITNTPLADETDPYDYEGGKNYTFLSNQYGFVNRFTAFIDSTISRIDTVIHYRYFTVSQPVSDFGINPLEYQFNEESGDYGLLFYYDGKYQWYSGKKEEDLVTFNLKVNENVDGDYQTKFSDKEILILKPDEKEGEIDINDYRFESDEKKPQKREDLITDLTNENVVADSSNLFLNVKSRNYRLNFATDEVLSQIDNTFNNQFYQNLSGPNSLYPGLSGMFQVAMSDLFEDYKLVGGLRLAGDLQNMDLGLQYQNLKNLVDKKITLQRQSQRIFGLTSIVKLQTHSGEFQLSRPINELLAVKTSLMLRNDRVIFLSTDPVNLAEPNRTFNTAGLKLELVFDNTLNKGLNLFNGTRFKIWGELYQDLRYDTFNSEAPDNSRYFLFEDQTDFKVVGFDFRHYEKIHRNMIAAIRVAGSTSFGSQKLLYYLGGVDNWLFQKVNENNDFDPEQNFVFQAMATPVRGFWLNSRNGNSMAVINGELRWPIFKYFMNKPIKSDFLENFQLVGFGDVGSAWTGSSPYAEDNYFNSTTFVESEPVTVTIQNNREPILYGYGFGMRSRVLGYFVRADWAWGVDDGIVLPRVFSLSLSLDF